MNNKDTDDSNANLLSVSDTGEVSYTYYKAPKSRKSCGKCIIATNICNTRQKVIMSIMTLIFVCIILIFVIVILPLNVLIVGNINDVPKKVIDLLPIQPTPEPIIIKTENSYAISKAFSYGRYATASREDSWAFSAVHALSSAYTKVGSEKKVMKDKEQTIFSTHALKNAAETYCTESKKCSGADNGKDGYVAWLSTLANEFSTKMAPELPECVPGITYNENNCINAIRNYYNSSPLKYTIKQYNSLSSVNGIKEALKKNDLEVSLMLDMFYDKQYVPCIERFGFLDTVCTQEDKTVYCPDDINAAYGQNIKCVAISTLASTSGSIGGSSDVSAGVHSMSIVGYNDDYVDENNKKGAFIVTAPWGNGLSHSINWLKGKISKEDEQYDCPNMENPAQWVSIQCMNTRACELRTLTLLAYRKEPIDSLYGFSADQATIDAYTVALDALNLSEDKAYALIKFIPAAGKTVQAILAVYDSKSIARRNPLGYTQQVTLPASNMGLIALYFRPQYNVVNNKNICGYYSLSYELFEKAINNGVMWASQFDIDFTTDSFVRTEDEHLKSQKRSEQEGYKQIWASTSEIQINQWNSNTPWLKDPNNKPKV